MLAPAGAAGAARRHRRGKSRELSRESLAPDSALLLSGGDPAEVAPSNLFNEMRLQTFLSAPFDPPRLEPSLTPSSNLFLLRRDLFSAGTSDQE